MAKKKINVDPVQERIDEQIMQSIKDKRMSPSERSDMYAVARFMHVNDRQSSESEYLLMYLNGDRDWKKDFTSVFGHKPGADK